MELLKELLPIVIIGALFSVGAYDALKSYIKHLLKKQEEKKWEDEIDNTDPLPPDVPDHDENDLVDEIKEDVEEIAEDAEDIVKDTTDGLLKLTGKVVKKALRLITFWRK